MPLDRDIGPIADDAPLAAVPLVVLDDADGGVRLYREPRAIITADSAREVAPALAAVRAAVAGGAHVAGYLAYEAGAALEPSVPLAGHDRLAWFGVFDRCDRLDDAAFAALLPDPAGAWIGAIRPRLSRSAYTPGVAALLGLINAGDVYQANFTFVADVAVTGDVWALYARLRAAQQARHCGMIVTGDETIVSLSPELFVAIHGGQVTCRPMKGTAARDGTTRDDDVMAALATDPKQRAENLMIVDLMRNDLAHVAVPGSVAVPTLFAVEAYPTLFQLVSTVTATLRPDVDAVAAVASLFPCGSVTGAPKIAAMQAIAALEAGPRGVYTGSIGHFSPDGDAAFNVAIRTLHLTPGRRDARLGLGSGIVADSDPTSEWDECLAKARFLAAGVAPFTLFETMAFRPAAGLVRRARHLARLAASAAALEFVCDPGMIAAALDAAVAGCDRPQRVRVSLAADGMVEVVLAALPAWPVSPIVAFAPRLVPPTDFRLAHKTSDRTPYAWPATAAGCDEVIFVADGVVTEGSFTTVFVARGGRLLTPPLARGILPGILRQTLLDTGRAVEADLRPADCADGLILGNSLRGLARARFVDRDTIAACP